MTTQTEFSPQRATNDELIAWLELRYEKRLALYPNILTDALYRHTNAAGRLRVLKATISLLRGEETYRPIYFDVLGDLIVEKDILLERFGFQRLCYQMYFRVIVELEKLKP